MEMLEFFQFYVSSFWIWAGLTIGLAVLLHGIAAMIEVIRG